MEISPKEVEERERVFEERETGIFVDDFQKRKRKKKSSNVLFCASVIRKEKETSN